MRSESEEEQDEPSEGEKASGESDGTAAFEAFKGGNLGDSFAGNIGNKRSIHRLIILEILGAGNLRGGIIK